MPRTRGARRAHRERREGQARRVADPRKPPPELPLECVALQSLPAKIDGKSLVLNGKSVSGWRERIGNAVPPDAAEAIGLRILFVLLEAALGGFSLASPDTPVWHGRLGQSHPQELR